MQTVSLGTEKPSLFFSCPGVIPSGLGADPLCQAEAAPARRICLEQLCPTQRHQRLSYPNPALHPALAVALGLAAQGRLLPVGWRHSDILVFHQEQPRCLLPWPPWLTRSPAASWREGDVPLGVRFRKGSALTRLPAAIPQMQLQKQGLLNQLFRHPQALH